MKDSILPHLSPGCLILGSLARGAVTLVCADPTDWSLLVPAILAELLGGGSLAGLAATTPTTMHILRQPSADLIFGNIAMPATTENFRVCIVGSKRDMWAELESLSPMICTFKPKIVVMILEDFTGRTQRGRPHINSYGAMGQLMLQLNRWAFANNVAVLLFHRALKLTTATADPVVVSRRIAGSVAIAAGAASTLIFTHIRNGSGGSRYYRLDLVGHYDSPMKPMPLLLTPGQPMAFCSLDEVPPIRPGQSPRRRRSRSPRGARIRRRDFHG